MPFRFVFWFVFFSGISTHFWSSVVSARIGYLWHISDFHFDPNYEPKELPCRRLYENIGMAYGDYGCDSSWSLIESALAFMKRMRGYDVEYVIWSGDHIAISKAYDPLTQSTSLLKKYFGSFFVLPVVGHDDVPQDDVKGYEKLRRLWKTWLPPDATDTLAKGGYYSIERTHPVRLTVVVINTNFMLTDDDPVGQFKWLHIVLEDARVNNHTVWLIGHVPPGFAKREGDFRPKCLMSDTSVEKYVALVEEYSSVIVGQFFGHLHVDTFRVFNNASGYPVSHAFVSPAISPRDYTNPSFRLYKYDVDSGQIFDYEQYYLDLKLANEKEKAEWQLEYAFLEYYGLNKIDSFGMNELASSLTKNYSPNFKKYTDAYLVRESPHRCEDSGQWLHYCAITALNASRYNLCVSEAGQHKIKCPSSFARLKSHTGKDGIVHFGTVETSAANFLLPFFKTVISPFLYFAFILWFYFF